MGCCDNDMSGTGFDPGYKKVLVAVLVINALMFVVEATSGVLAGSRALQADALDFFSDAANYGLTLWVLGQSVLWRLRAARIKAYSLLVLGGWVLADSVVAMIAGDGRVPGGVAITGIGALALTANLTSLALLMRYRRGDANIRSVWLCSRNDAIANLAVIGAGAAVLVAGSRWPDLIVAVGLAGLFTHSAVSILRQAHQEARRPHYA